MVVEARRDRDLCGRHSLASLGGPGTFPPAVWAAFARRSADTTIAVSKPKDGGSSKQSPAS